MDGVVRLLDQSAASGACEPKGPDFAAINKAREGIERTRQEYRRRWRNKHEITDGGDASPLAQKPRLYEATSAMRAEYLRRGERLFSLYAHETGLPCSKDRLSPLAFASWILGREPLLDLSTRRNYYAFATALIETFPDHSRGEALAMLSVEAGFRSRARQNSNVPTRFDWHHHNVVRKFLRASTLYGGSDCAEDWLVSSLHTGLSPQEWALTDIEQVGKSSIWLHVVSSEVDPEYSAWSYRSLDISNFNPEVLASIARMVDRGRSWATSGRFAKKQSEANALLSRACKAAIPRLQAPYSLESARYQFIENMRTKCAEEDVAALVGTICLEFNRASYHHRRAAWQDDEIKNIPIPSAKLVANMRLRLEVFSLRVMARKLMSRRGF